eukprot:GHVU01177873.1.p1 GENE.GHVU01177873.1~~GHVU01177873.1.p1  ORF type:complete len:768 (+),score=67.45 GHVU01177873.1:515-2818(+)
MGLVKAVISRAHGHINARFSEDVIALCQVLHSKNPAAYLLFKNNIVGISHRHIQRLQQRDRSTCILDVSGIGTRISEWAAALSSVKGGPVACSLAFDASMVPPCEEISSAFGVVVGGNAPNHMLPIDAEQRPIAPRDLAREVKCALLTTQDVTQGVSPMKILAARPQKPNERCDEYNLLVVNSVKSCGMVRLVSVAVDGLASESYYIRDGLIDFMLGRDTCVYFVDPNHVAKAMRSQLILGTCVIIMGSTAFDPGLFYAAGVKTELFRVDDYTSDGLVLQLCSASTLKCLQRIAATEDASSVAVTGLTLFFLRIFLEGVNSKVEMGVVNRVAFMWSSLLWLTSLEGIHITTKRNLVNSVLGCVFLCVQAQVKAVRLCTTETLEHFFGNLRQWRREFSTKDLIERAAVVETTFKNMMNYNIVGSSCKKGYMYTFDAYRQQVASMMSAQAASCARPAAQLGSGSLDPFGRDDAGVGSATINGELIRVLNAVSNEMTPFLRQLGCTTVSPFCRDFSDLRDLASVFFNYMPPDYRKASRHQGLLAPGGSTDDGEEEECGYNDGDCATGDADAPLHHIVSSLNEQAAVAVEDVIVSDAVPADEPVVSNEFLPDCDAFNSILTLQKDELAGERCFVLALDCLDGVRAKESGREDSLLKANTLQGRWWAKAGTAVAAPCHSDGAKYLLTRNDVFRVDGRSLRILSVYRKSYNKCRIIQAAASDSGTKVHYVEVAENFGSLTTKKAEKGKCRYGSILGSELAEGKKIVTRQEEFI